MKSNIVSMPTSAGKSLVAEIIISKELANSDRKQIVYITPKVALCEQVKDDLKKKFGKVTYDLDWLFDSSTDESVWVKIYTPEKFQLILNRDSIKLSDVSLIIFDEFHNIGEGNRGAKMELLINIIKTQRKKGLLDLKILGLSAIIGNPREVNSWLEDREVDKSKSTISNKNPTRKQLMYFNEYVYYCKGLEKSEEKRYEAKNLIIGEKFPNLKKIEKVFIYRSSSRWIKSEINFIIGLNKSEKIKINISDNSINLLQEFSSLFEEERQKEAILNGIGFLYKDISEWQKNEIIKLYKGNVLKIIVGNNVVDEGVNLDIEYLILGDVQRRNEKKEKSEEIPSSSLFNSRVTK